MSEVCVMNSCSKFEQASTLYGDFRLVEDTHHRGDQSVADGAVRLCSMCATDTQEPSAWLAGAVVPAWEQAVRAIPLMADGALRRPSDGSFDLVQRRDNHGRGNTSPAASAASAAPTAPATTPTDSRAHRRRGDCG